ncbi:PREDICTED: protein CROWDED NUCLEI 1-like [Tarenaya hassleriana]|uniref:protein CROWDED NUCLEI 1-like n=1 Tax=Tarenaya hassleriana TaxID=28532 RepID=UPI00053C4845|nr:PREDICTED: protein CROWDED NUCLEI 1-like [Tarenaya hassleriana]XP_010528465.1 PREDICTED: protein CROWDED NUCLEI 1-like [Tarenaya hassleriana]
MLTPQKVWNRWSLAPHRRGAGSGSGSGLGPDSNGSNPGEDGAGVNGSDMATPVPGRVGENGIRYDDTGTLVEKVSQLEKELFEYQYNMGLLLIEKKDCTSKYEELKHELVEANECRQRERTTHLIAVSDVEKREEGLRKALGVEKQCVLDLEKALHELRSENAVIKFTADSKLAEANALVTSIEEKSLEIEMKLHSADAKLAEVSRKSSEVERNSKELESRENYLQRDRLSHINEREAQEASLSKQREDLHEWERQLQEGEERVAKAQLIVKQREERANENDKIIKQKEKELEETQKKIDAANLALKKKEDGISSRQKNVALREHEADALKKSLETKEQELLALQQKLDAREKAAVQELVDEHQTKLDAKQREFEFEMEEKRKSVDDDLRSKVVEVEKREAELHHIEEKIARREQTVDKKLEKVKEKERDFESRLKNLKDREKALKMEENALENEKRKLFDDRENLLNLKAEVEKIKAENDAQLVKMREEKEDLRVTEVERSSYLRLQSELKEQIEKCRSQQVLLLKETEDLKAQKEAFEKEWEELDERKAEIEKELKNINDQKEKLDKYRQTEEERLRKEKQAGDDSIKRELEALEAAKDLFAATMEHERSAVSEKSESERIQLLHDFEMRKRTLETDMQLKLEERERELQVKEKLFEEERERELSNINYLREVARREMEDMKMERLRIEKEKVEVDSSKKHLEEQQVEIRKDVDDLVALTKKLKEQRELFINERNRFLSFVENHKNCKQCGEVLFEPVLPDFDSLIPNLSRLDNNPDSEAPSQKMRDVSPALTGSGSPDPGGSVSWFQRCTSKILKLSPIKRMELSATQNLADNVPKSGEEGHMESRPSNFTQAVAVQSDTGVRKVEVTNDHSDNNHSNIDSKAHEVAEDSVSNLDVDGQQPRRRGKVRVRRTRSVKAVVEDAKAILGKSLEFKEPEDSNANCEDSEKANDECRSGHGQINRGTSRNGRKRTHTDSLKACTSEQDGDESDVKSDSVTAGAVQHGKRRQKVVTEPQGVGEQRYNLRRPRRGAGGNNPSKENEETSDIRRDKDIFCAQTSASASIGVAVSENGGSTSLVRREEVANSQETDAGSPKRMEVGVEEVNETPERVGEEGEEEDEEEEEETGQHPGEVSIGKKLWTFLTT